jgi:predicted NBD/HSP70 family sugar kinase
MTARPSPLPSTDERLSPNERRVLDIVLRHEQVTRADVTRIIGLTAQSSMRLVAQLEDRALIESGERVIRGRGQPSRYIRLRRDARMTVGVSIMTDGLVAVLMNLACEAIDELRAPLPDPGLEGLTTAVTSLIDALLRRHGHDGRSHLAGVGGALSGYFVDRGSRLNTPDTLGGLALIDIEAALGSALGLPVIIENDGNAAAIGESLGGVGRTMRTLVYFYFAEGFGGGVVIDGTPWRGVHGNAGEIGGLLPHDDYPSPTLANLRRHIAAHGRCFASLDSMLSDFDPAWNGTAEWLAEVTPTLSIIASAAATLLDPDAIVLGGRLPRVLAPLLIDAIRINNSGRRALARPEPKIVATATAFDAAAVGAASLPLQALYFA